MDIIIKLDVHAHTCNLQHTGLADCNPLIVGSPFKM